MLQIVTAIEQDGMDKRTLTIAFEVPDGKFDLVEAVKAAATDYCLTPEGRGTFDYNCHCFNWADFDSEVPNKFMEKYGFRKVEDGFLADIQVNWDEHLVDDDLILNDEEVNESFVAEGDPSDVLDEESPRAGESPRTIMVREKHPVKVRWIDQTEGQWGDYNPEDPDDVPLLRFDVSLWNEAAGKYNSCQSRCTCFCADASKEDIAKALDILLDRFYDAYSKNPNGSLKTLADQLSQISENNYQSMVLNGGM